MNIVLIEGGSFDLKNTMPLNRVAKLASEEATARSFGQCPPTCRKRVSTQRYVRAARTRREGAYTSEPASRSPDAYRCPLCQ